MKKFILLLLTLHVVAIIAQSDSEESISNGLKDKYLKHYHAKKKQYISLVSEKIETRCLGINGKIEHADKIFDECMKSIDIDDSLTLCEKGKKFLLNCTQPYIEVAYTCLPEDAKGLPSLFVKAMYSIFDYLCTRSGESLLEFANPCVWKNLGRPEMKQCSEKIKNIRKTYWEKVPSMNQVCSDTLGFRNCYQSLVSECKNPVTKRAHFGLYEAAVSPCSNITEYNY